MLWMINLSLSLAEKNLKKLFEAKIDRDRNHFELIILFGIPKFKPSQEKIQFLFVNVINYPKNLQKYDHATRC